MMTFLSFLPFIIVATAFSVYLIAAHEDEARKLKNRKKHIHNHKTA
jgi:hypothetical protein